MVPACTSSMLSTVQFNAFNSRKEASITSPCPKAYTVGTASDGVEGIEKANARSFDLIITDANMPRIGGHEMIQMLRANPRDGDAPDVLMLSASNDINRAVEAMRLGAVNYLVKPVDSDQLLAEVQAVMQARRDRAREPHPATSTSSGRSRFATTASTRYPNSDR